MGNIYSLGTCAFIGGRQSGAVLYNTFGVMGKSRDTERGGLLASNNSSDSPTGSGYNTDVSDDNLPCDRISPTSDINGNSVSDEQVCIYYVEMTGLWLGGFFLRLLTFVIKKLTVEQLCQLHSCCLLVH